MLTKDQEAEIVYRVASGERQRQVAARYGISQQMVSKLWRRAVKVRKGRHGGDRRSARHETIQQRRSNRLQ